ncbi:hypothetical protein D3C86_1405250 [compost metagenome]
MYVKEIFGMFATIRLFPEDILGLESACIEQGAGGGHKTCLGGLDCNHLRIFKLRLVKFC